KPLRYQLTGAHGLPVEGEWYNMTPRSAVIGTLDKNGNLWRELEDAQRISTQLGGDRVVAQTNILHYAGILNQYFGSVIVNKNENNVLEWARATLETTDV